MNHLILIISLLLFGQAVLAQNTKHVQLSEATKIALKDYQNKEIYPVKKSIHDQLWGSLSEADRSFVETKRVQYDSLRREARQVRKQLRRDRRAGQATNRAAAMAPIQIQQKALLEALLPILEANQSAFNKAMQDLKGHRVEWATARKAILKQYESEETLGQLRQCREQRKKRRAKYGQTMSSEQRQVLRAARFLLWNKQPYRYRRGGTR